MGIGDYSTDPDAHVTIGDWRIRQIMADLAAAREDGTFGGTVTPPGGSEPIPFQRKTEHNIDLRDYIPAGQHNAVYAGTSDYDALADVHKALNETIVANTYAGPTINLPYGKILLSGPIQLKKVVGLVGHSSPMSGSYRGTILSWPELSGESGIYVNRHDTLGEDTVAAGSRADGSLIQGVHLLGPGGYDAAGLTHGIRLRARVRLIVVSVHSFPADGVHGASLGGNLNSNIIHGLNVESNGRHGIFVSGGDANASTCTGVYALNNGGYGIYDSSFLGNLWSGGNLTNNGRKGQVSYGGNRYYLLSGDGAATTPGTDEAVWRLIGAGGVHSLYPAWSAEGVYFRAGAICSDNQNSRSQFIGHYVEPGQPPSFIISPATYKPGHDVTGLTPDSSAPNEIAGILSRYSMKRVSYFDLKAASGSTAREAFLHNSTTNLATNRGVALEFQAAFETDGVTPRKLSTAYGISRSASLTTGRQAAGFEIWDENTDTFKIAFEADGNANAWLPREGDNIWSIGSFALRILKGWFGNISLFPAASVTPANNGEVTFQLTNDTSLTFKVKGSDGVVRSGSVALS